MHTIYCMLNRITGKHYIGQTKRPLTVRLKAHADSARYGRTYRLCDAIRAYGIDSFEICAIAEAANKTDADDLERTWIAITSAHDPGTGYNGSFGGGGGGSWTPDTKALQIANRKGKPATVAQMKGLRAGWKLGFRPSGPLSAEHRRKISAANKGRVVSEDTARKISEAKKGRRAHPNSLKCLELGPTRKK